MTVFTAVGCCQQDPVREGVSERHEREFGKCPHWRTKFVGWSRAPFCIDCNTTVCAGTCVARCWEMAG